jgi:predicted transcriptional regulator
VQEGIEAVKRGQVVSHAEAKERIRALGVAID